MIETLTPAIVRSDRAQGTRPIARAPDTRGLAGDLIATLRRHVFRPRMLLSVVAALVAAGFVARHAFDVNLAVTWSVLRHADPGLLGLGLVVFYLIFPIRAMRWRTLLTNVGLTRSVGYAMPSLFGYIRLLVVAAFANSVTVAQLGDAYRAYLIKRDAHAPLSLTLGTILAERLLDLLVLVAMLSAATLTAFAGHLPGKVVDVLIVGLVLAGFGLVFVIALRRLRTMVTRLIPSRWHDDYRKFEVGAVGSLRRVPLLIFYSAVAWLIEGVTIYLLARAVAAPVSTVGALVVGLVASLLSSEPFTPGGLGATEAGIVLVLTGLGVTPDVAAAVAVLNRLVNYLSLGLVGPALYLAPRLCQGIVRRHASVVSGGGLTRRC